MCLKGVIFDLDGVLVDTAKFHYLGWKRLADEYKVPFDEKKNERFKGVSRMDCIRILFPDVKDEKRLVRMATQKNNYYREYIEKLKPEDLFDGAKSLIDELRYNGIKTAIGSASKNALRVVQKLEIYELFDSVADGTKAENSKPAPDVFLVAAKEMNIEPSESIVLEDAEAGIKAAHAAGMTAVGIGEKTILKEAEIVVPSVKELSFERLKGLI